MMNIHSNKKEILSRKILNYLKEHPEAGDTLEGIANWWVVQQRIEEMVDEVAAALEDLIERGSIHALESHSGVTIYKIKKNDE
jgi:hypothetical protein